MVLLFYCFIVLLLYCWRTRAQIHQFATIGNSAKTFAFPDAPTLAARRGGLLYAHVFFQWRGIMGNGSLYAIPLRRNAIGIGSLIVLRRVALWL